MFSYGGQQLQNCNSGSPLYPFKCSAEEAGCSGPSGLIDLSSLPAPYHPPQKQQENLLYTQSCQCRYQTLTTMNALHSYPPFSTSEEYPFPSGSNVDGHFNPAFANYNSLNIDTTPQHPSPHTSVSSPRTIKSSGSRHVNNTAAGQSHSLRTQTNAQAAGTVSTPSTSSPHPTPQASRNNLVFKNSTSSYPSGGAVTGAADDRMCHRSKATQTLLRRATSPHAQTHCQTMAEFPTSRQRVKILLIHSATPSLSSHRHPI